MKRPSSARVLLPISMLLAAACTEPDPDLNAPPAASAIRHLVVIIQENHTFDNYFGRYCTAAPGSAPTCESGPGCCEAAPSVEPGAMSAPVEMNDGSHGAFDPNHTAVCEVDQINGGKMDRFVTSAICGDRRNFAVAPASVARPYWELAARGALADHYFQPVVGASASNDMYFARARFVFGDNDLVPKSVGNRCTLTPQKSVEYTDTTIGDLLAGRGVPWAFYAEGYAAAVEAEATGQCPEAPEACPLGLRIYPCVFDPGDVPFEYYPSSRDNPAHMRDLERLHADLVEGTLPAVVYVKAIGYKTEHPGLGNTIREGTSFVTGLVDEILGSRYGKSTLVIFTYDEGGGYYDHIAPPPTSKVDDQPYGTRVPAIALGPFARVGAITHDTLEHSSLVRFIEWNWLGGTGQLGGRDAEVRNLGGLLDPQKTAVAVPR